VKVLDGTSVRRGKGSLYVEFEEKKYERWEREKEREVGETVSRFGQCQLDSSLSRTI